MARMMMATEEFQELEETTGTIQNISECYSIEVSDDDSEKNQGIVLAPGEGFSWENQTIFVRKHYTAGVPVEVRILPFAQGGSGGGEDPGNYAIRAYGVCYTIGSVAQKNVSIDGFVLAEGAVAYVYFVNNNTATNPTLNISSTGAKPIYKSISQIESGTFLAGGIYEFVYNANKYRLVGQTVNEEVIMDVPVIVPSTYTATGSTITPTWYNYDSTQLTIGGTTSASAMGEYVATFTPKSGYVWADGKTDAKSVKWNILPDVGTLNDTSWDVISQVAQAGVADLLWDIGDGKEITLNGTADGVTYDNYTCEAVLIGIDHNAEYEGTNRLHFIIGRKDGKDICLYSYKMNDTDTNVGGWKDSRMRNTTMPAIFNILPSDLQAVIADTTKYTDNVGGASGSVEANVTATTDKLFLLSEREVFGTSTAISNTYERDKCTQYQYYASGNSKVRYRHIELLKIGWFERSPSSFATNCFCAAGSNDTSGQSLAGNSRGVAPGFTIA